MVFSQANGNLKNLVLENASLVTICWTLPIHPAAKAGPAHQVGI
jgi:hypothetical protein